MECERSDTAIAAVTATMRVVIVATITKTPAIGTATKVRAYDAPDDVSRLLPTATLT